MARPNSLQTKIEARIARFDSLTRNGLIHRHKAIEAWIDPCDALKAAVEQRFGREFAAAQCLGEF